MSEIRKEHISSKNFTFEKETKTFSAFMSDLQMRFVPIYDDACDYGFTMVSAKTGKVANFYFVGPLMSNGELGGWELAPTSEAIKNNPGLRGTKVFIFNS